MKLFTIGFTKKTAEKFFTELQSHGVKRIIDVRLNNVSQLAGFTKRDDLRYFANTICQIEYLHLVELAPTSSILDPYKKRKEIDWRTYERNFMDLMEKRQIEKTLQRETIDGACLLCSEEKPHHCHRRLVAEYLRDKWGGIEIEHIT